MNKTTAALKLVEEALEYARSSSQNQEMWGYFNKALQGLYAIRAEVLAKPEITTPDVCGEVCARAKLCYGCGKALDEANAKLADHSGDANEMVSEHKCGGCAKTAADGWALYCVECWEKAEPVKQEPVAEVDTDSFGCINWLKTCPDNGTKLYAAPVDAKAIRADALEEAAKVCDAIEEDHWNLYKGRKPYTGSEAGRADPHEQGVSMGAEECAAAIRGMK